jgi:uncharacterized OB-fold protein
VAKPVLESIPVLSGLFEPGPPAVLLGSKCARCGSHYFPRTALCRNPACAGTIVQDVSLSRRGRLYSFTVQHYRPPAPFEMQAWAPYAIGILELPEGLRIMGMLTGIADAQLAIGMPLEVVTAALRQDDAGRDVLTYQFAPATESAA